MNKLLPLFFSLFFSVCLLLLPSKSFANPSGAIVRSDSICIGSSLDLNRCLSQIPNTVRKGSEHWYLIDGSSAGMLLNSSVITPSTTNRYFWQCTKTDGNIYRDTLEILVEHEPFAVLPSNLGGDICKGTHITFTLTNKQNIDSIVWTDNTHAIDYKEGEHLAILSNSHFTVKAWNKICTRSTWENTIAFKLLNTLTADELNIAAPILSSAICESCPITLPPKGDFAHNGDHIDWDNLQWENVKDPSLVILPNGKQNLQYIALVSATVTSRLCNLKKTFVQERIPYLVSSKRCLPSLRLDQTQYCPCDSAFVFLVNPNINSCLFSITDIGIRSSPLLSHFSFMDSVGAPIRNYRFSANPVDTTSLEISIPCQLQCPKQFISKPVTLTDTFKIKDCSPLYTYTYCIGEPLHLRFTSQSKTQKIQTIQIQAPLNNHLVSTTQTDEFWEYKSVNSIQTKADSSLLANLPYTLEYKNAFCNNLISLKDTAHLVLNDCSPTIQLSYPKQTPKYICMGDTLHLRISKQSAAITLDKIVFKTAKENIIQAYDTLSSQDVKQFLYYFFLYKDDSLWIDVQYTEAGKVKHIKDTHKLSLTSCPHEFRILQDAVCRGEEIKLQLQLKNPTSKIQSLQWKTQPPCPIIEEDTVFLSEGRTLYTFKAYPQAQTEINCHLIYNEGQITQNKQENKTTRTLACKPKVSPNSIQFCVGDTLIFKVETATIWDTIVSIDWSNNPGSTFELLRTEASAEAGKLCYFYRSLARSDSTYHLRTQIKNREVLYTLEDTLKFASSPYPKAFIKDTIGVCRGNTFDLRTLENTSILKNIQYQNTQPITPSNSNFYLVHCQALYHCQFMPPYTNEFKDSIWVDVEDPVWISALESPMEVCEFSNFKLFTNTNGLLTWVKKAQGFSDTLYKNISPHIQTLTDKISKSCTYQAIATNSCPSIQSTQVDITLLAAPILHLSQHTYRACLYDSVLLKAHCEKCQNTAAYWEYQKIKYPSEKRINLTALDSSFAIYHAVNPSNQCTHTDTALVLAYPLPTIYFSSGDSLFCAKPNETHGIFACGADRYQWLDPLMQTTNFIFVSSPITTQYRVVGSENTQQCKDTASYLYIVNTPKLSPLDTAVCTGETYTAHLTPIDSTSYLWRNPEGLLFAKTNRIQVENIQAKDTGYYTLYLNQRSCLDSVRIHLHSLVVPEGKIWANSPLCEGSTLYLKAQSTPKADRYTWLLKNGSQIVAPIDSLVDIHRNEAGSYYLKSQLGQCVHIDSIDIRVDTNEQAFFLPQAFYCEGDPVVLNTLDPNQDDSTFYFWQLPSQILPSNGNLLISSVSLMDSGNWCLIRKRYTCLSSMCQFVKVRKRPTPILVYAAQYCENEPLILNASHIDVKSGSAWFFKGSLVGKNSLLSLGQATQKLRGWYTYINTFNGCKSIPDSVYPTIIPLPQIDFGSTNFLCPNDSLYLDVSRKGGSYLWNNGSREGAIWVFDSAWYRVEVSQNNCRTTDSIFIRIHPRPLVFLGNDTSLCRGQVLFLEGPSQMDSYLWSDQSTQTSFTATTEGMVRLKVSKDGCEASDSLFVDYRFCGQLYVPNAFTPNEDGINDLFKIISYAHENEIEYTISIFNRNGKCVFSSHSIAQSWDGTFKGQKCPEGVYIYQILAKDKESGIDLSKRGSLTIIR